MRLIIGDSSDINLDDITLSVLDFSCKQAQPFVATGKWDCCIVDIDNSMVTPYLQELSKHFRVIPSFKEVTKDVVYNLGIIYPDCRAELSFKWLRNKEGLQDVIKKISSDFDWERYL